MSKKCDSVRPSSSQSTFVSLPVSPLHRTSHSVLAVIVVAVLETGYPFLPSSSSSSLIALCRGREGGIEGACIPRIPLPLHCELGEWMSFCHYSDLNHVAVASSVHGRGDAGRTRSVVAVYPGAKEAQQDHTHYDNQELGHLIRFCLRLFSGLESTPKMTVVNNEQSI